MAQKSLKSRVYLKTRLFVAALGIPLIWINLGKPIPSSIPGQIPLPAWLLSVLTVLVSILVVAVSNLPGTNTKARIVFLRWKHPLPGSRAFEQRNLGGDARINQDQLKLMLGGKFPRGAVEQNAIWYGLYQKTQDDPRVQESQYEFLLFRDLTWLSIVFLVTSIVSAISNPSSRPIIYPAIVVFVGLCLLFRGSAAERGRRFVNTVLAMTASRKESTNI